VTDKLRVKSVSYQVSQLKKFPVDFSSTVLFPDKISSISAATNDHYIHIQVSASFVKSSVKPAQVFFTVRKNEKGHRNLGVNTYGKLNTETGFYEITLDVTKDMDHINGDYDMEVHVGDPRAEQRLVWQLGSIRIWFKEGSDEATNEGVKEEYKPG
jgi:hypothetical protein